MFSLIPRLKLIFNCQKLPKVFPMALNHIPMSLSKGYHQKTYQWVIFFLFSKKVLKKVLFYHNICPLMIKFFPLKGQKPQFLC